MEFEKILQATTISFSKTTEDDRNETSVLLEGTDKIFRSDNNPSTKIKIKKTNVIISLSLKMNEKKRIKKIPPDKGVFFVPKIF